MIYNNIEFHNVERLEQKGSVPGLLLQRFPENARMLLGDGDHERGRFYAQVSTGCELRFVTDAYFFRLSLSAYPEDTHVMVFCGDFLHSVHKLEAGKVTTMHIEVPPSLKNSESWVKEGHRFSPNVWRVLFHKQSGGVFCDLDTFGHGVRPPLPEEVPAKKMLCYGSSITFGGDVHLASNVYVYQAARRLGIDVENKAIAGSCFCDHSMIKYLSGKKDWDICVLELGINMLGRFTVEEFAARAKKLVEWMLQSNPGKPVVLLSAFPANPFFAVNSAQKEKFLAYENSLRKIGEAFPEHNLHFIEGSRILTDVSGLTVDMVHPSDDGHIQMGYNLAEYLRPLL